VICSTYTRSAHGQATLMVLYVMSIRSAFSRHCPKVSFLIERSFHRPFSCVLSLPKTGIYLPYYEIKWHLANCNLVFLLLRQKLCILARFHSDSVARTGALTARLWKMKFPSWAKARGSASIGLSCRLYVALLRRYITATQPINGITTDQYSTKRSG
jgi:hypothetical protein